MNSFSGLRQEKIDPDETIRTGKQLRKQKKKLRNLEGKEQTPENMKKRKRIVVAIEEYENKGKQQKKPKKKQKKKGADDKELEKAVQEANTPEYKQAKQDAEDARRRKEEERQARRDTARQEKQRKRQEQQEQQEQEQQEQQEQQWRQQWQQKWWQHQQQQQQRSHQGSQGSREDTPEGTLADLQEFLKQHNAPEDIISLANDYDEKLFKKLHLKYHPDKPRGTDDLGMCLNNIRDHHKPKVHENDETWVK